MLVLSRGEGQAVIAGDVEVTVVEVKGNRVKLGFTADPGVPIHRKEIVLEYRPDYVGDTE